MTDTELSVIERVAKAVPNGPLKKDIHGMNNEFAIYAAIANPTTILKLITELRQIKAERDWLAKLAASNIPTINDFVRATQGWLDAVKEATSCQKN